MGLGYWHVKAYFLGQAWMPDHITYIKKYYIQLTCPVGQVRYSFYLPFSYNLQILLGSTCPGQAPLQCRALVIGLAKSGTPRPVIYGSNLSDVLARKHVGLQVNPFNAEATVFQSAMTQILLKTIQTLSCWYSLESSRWVLSDEYPYAKLSVIFRGFCIILYWPN